MYLSIKKVSFKIFYIYTYKNLENSCKICFYSSSLVIFEMCGQNESFDFFFPLNVYFSMRAVLVVFLYLTFFCYWLLLEPWCLSYLSSECRSSEASDDTTKLLLWLCFKGLGQATILDPVCTDF